MKRALFAAVLAALATTAVLATVGFGASTTATTSSKKSSSKRAQTQAGPPKTMAEAQKLRDAAQAAFYKKLGDKVGKSAAEVEAAFDKVMKDKLDAEVKANRLTQAQEDAILACKAAPLTCDRSNLPAGGPRGRHGGPGHKRGGRAAELKALATALGVDEAALKTAMQSLRPARPSGDGPRGHGPRGGMGFDGPPPGAPQGPGASYSAPAAPQGGWS